MKKKFNSHKTLNELFFVVFHYPQLYVRHKNIYELQSLIDGWLSGEANCSTGENNNRADLLRIDLQDFILSKLQKKGQMWYDDALLEASNGDPEKAFDLYFELYDEFKKEHDICAEYDQHLVREESVIGQKIIAYMESHARAYKADIFSIDAIPGMLDILDTDGAFIQGIKVYTLTPSSETEMGKKTPYTHLVEDLCQDLSALSPQEAMKFCREYFSKPHDSQHYYQILYYLKK